MSGRRPSVSVVVPCRDAAPYLEETLRSLVDQTHPPVEVLVVDDGSRDGSQEIARSFEGPVRVLESGERGAPAARNAGARAAVGETLLFCDADDRLDPLVLDGLAAALERAPDAVAGCPWRRWELGPWGWTARPPSCRPRAPGEDPLAAWLAGWYHPPCSLLWSRPAWEGAGPWDESLPVNQDGDLAMRALALGVSLVPAERGMAYYRRAPSGRSSVSARGRTREGVAARLAVLERLAGLLDERGLLPDYRVSLGMAAADVLHDCEATPSETRERAAELALRWAGPRWRRALRRRGGGLRLRLARLRGTDAGAG